MDEIDLYIDGADFYSGSTVKALKNGWCNFRKLGRALAQRHLGKSVDVGRIYYLNSAIGHSVTASYEEATRKALWMGALRQEVDPFIIKRSANAELALARPEDRPLAVVIAAGRIQFSPIEKAVKARYNDNVALAIPPDCERSRSDAWCLSHSDLGAAHLENAIYAPDALYRWAEYEKSKKNGLLVFDYYNELQSPLLGFFENELKKCNLSGQDLPMDIKIRLQKRVEQELRGPNFDSALARSKSCRDFIAEKMIASTAALFTGSRAILPEEVPTSHLPAAGRPGRPVEITDSYLRALEGLEGKDQEVTERAVSHFEMNPKQPGLSLERVDETKDPNLWFLRASLGIRIIVRRVPGKDTLLYVGHHTKTDLWTRHR